MLNPNVHEELISHVRDGADGKEKSINLVSYVPILNKRNKRFESSARSGDITIVI